ncbi:hypothetical protein F5876DRAFT_74380 [Lentinula aff. lateritia]|uniref:Uncharacterized protein n=1 Tax=Lentinula aff. lateritia TaxID=2804960 RepID=A0ACC1U758_9AGAR|nr:hypothetical protein F5876DRAFT_74380 [Lentinula aff. lateritia]
MSCTKCGYSSDRAPLPIPLHSTRIDNLLHTNDSPTEDEQKTLETFLGHGNLELQHLNARIVSVEALLEELERAKALLAKAVSEHKTVLNPLRRMPDDLLVEIFLHGAGLYIDPGDYFPSARHSLDLNSPPWTYSRVCRRLRETAMHTPLLWTRVKIEADHLIQNVQNRYPSQSPLLFGLSLLSGYLSRSAALPLAIYLDMPSYRLDKYAHSISALVASHSQRWESLFLGIVQSFDSNNMVLSEDSFPLLRRLQVDVRGVSPSVDIPAPNLKAYSIVGRVGGAGYSFTEASLSTKLCSQITNCLLSNISYKVALRVCKHLPHLSRLMVQNLQDDLSPNVWDQIKTFPNLQELFVEHSISSTADCTDILNPFFSLMTCPALKSLSVKSFFHAPLEFTIKEFEKRSAFNLECLDINAWTNIYKDIQSTMNLMSLAVSDLSYDNANDVFHQLKPLESTTITPFPVLHRLELHLRQSRWPYFCWETYNVMEALYRCVSSRLSTANSSNLSPLEVFITAPDQEARKMLDHPRLGTLRSLGMKVDIIAS